MRMYLYQIPVNNGGYDSWGMYHGIPTHSGPVYYYEPAKEYRGEGPRGYLRATSREKAKEQVKKIVSNASFFR